MGYCCPFENDSCRGTRPFFMKFNRINGVSNMCAHLKKCHAASGEPITPHDD